MSDYFNELIHTDSCALGKEYKRNYCSNDDVEQVKVTYISVFTLHGNGTGTTGNNGALIPVPFLDQCEHFHMAGYFLFDPFADRGPFPTQRE